MFLYSAITTILLHKGKMQYGCALLINCKDTYFSIGEILPKGADSQFSCMTKSSIYNTKRVKYNFLAWDRIEVKLYV